MDIDDLGERNKDWGGRNQYFWGSATKEKKNKKKLKASMKLPQIEGC